MDYSKLYVKRIEYLCSQRRISINKLAAMSDVKQSTLDNKCMALQKILELKQFTKKPLLLI